jgi:hypothetical protein
MFPVRMDGDMHHGVQRRAAERAYALGARVLWALFAVVALCATPLGTGELFAAESYVYERKKAETREGDLPLRFATQGGVGQALEIIEEPAPTTLAPALADDAPDAIAATAASCVGETGSVAASLPRHGVCQEPPTSFRARAPPRA